MLSSLPSLPLPAAARSFALSLLLMALLAGIDIVASIAAREWTERREPLLYGGGLILYVALYVVFAQSLKLADMWLVSLGWFVCLRIGLTLVDRLYYHRPVSLQTWLILLVFVALQLYSMLSQPGERS